MKKKLNILDEKFLIIHGPCSLESKKQMEEIVEELKEISTYFRSGIYKPRTNPESFQGLKKEGLKILKEIKAINPEITSIVEITDIRQLDNIEEIDVIQIGARNMQNYEFLVEVGKTHKPILLKRGFGATLEELIGSAKYIEKQGNKNIILCERGIRTFSTSSRFTLDLSAISYLKEFTNYKVIVDPSHAGGKSDEVKHLARAAAAYGCDGLMIEVHPNPLEALSDSEQQLKIEEYKELIKDIKKIINI